MPQEASQQRPALHAVWCLTPSSRMATCLCSKRGNKARFVHQNNAISYEKFWGFVFSDSMSPRYPRTLKNTNFSTLNWYKNCRSRSTWNLVQTMLKTQGEDRYKSHCLIRHPSRDIIVAKLHSIYKSSEYDKKNEKMAGLRCPAQFWEIRSEILTPYLNRMCTQRQSRAFFFFFFHSGYGRFCIFRIFISAISLRQKKETRSPAFRLLVSA